MMENSDAIPKRGRLLGIDFGTKRIGVAVSDTGQSLSSPLHNYDRSSAAADKQFFRKVCSDYEIRGMVVGLPLHMSGDESGKSKEARAYADQLSAWTQLPVTFQDERYSSRKAGAMLIQANMTSKQRKARMDKLAAQIVLQDFLDARMEPSDDDASDASDLSPVSDV